MAFAVHKIIEHCTGCNNCVVACPVDAFELRTVDPASREKIYLVMDRKSVILDFRSKLCAGCGVCVQVCPYGVIRLAGPWESRSAANVQ
jgi:4Fe-4S ferredoxin